MTVVLDASVLLKWFVQEPGSDAALDFQRRYLEGTVTIAVPDLALYEIPNVLRFKRGVPEAEVKAVMHAFWTLDLETVMPTVRMIDEAISFSFATGLSVYDCAYLALAKELGSVLVTADERLHRAVPTVMRSTLIGKIS